MRVSVIIAVEELNDLVQENIGHLLQMEFPDFEIIVFLSQPTTATFPKTKILVRPDLAFNPAKRRDLAISEARGEILAFIDDDAYPAPDWLNAALPYFEDLNIAAVGGPGITPPEDSLLQQVSGWCSASPFGGGPTVSYRFLPSRAREVRDYPSMNLLVRKSDFEMVGGFDSNFWPGEDTKLCLDLTEKIGKRIIYDPRVVVFHHRRGIFREHLRQNGRYGLHRGYFARVLPATSRWLIYFLPSIWDVILFLTPPLTFLAGRWGGVNVYLLAVPYLAVVLIYFLLLSANSFWIWRRSRSGRVAFLALPTVFLTHLWYGLQFIRGFTLGKIKR